MVIINHIIFIELKKMASEKGKEQDSKDYEAWKKAWEEKTTHQDHNKFVETDKKWECFQCGRGMEHPDYRLKKRENQRIQEKKDRRKSYLLHKSDYDSSAWEQYLSEFGSTIEKNIPEDP